MHDFNLTRYVNQVKLEHQKKIIQHPQKDFVTEDTKEYPISADSNPITENTGEEIVTEKSKQNLITRTLWRTLSMRNLNKNLSLRTPNKNL